MATEGPNQVHSANKFLFSPQLKMATSILGTSSFSELGFSEQLSSSRFSNLSQNQNFFERLHGETPNDFVKKRLLKFLQN